MGTMKTSPLTLALIIPIILVSAGSRSRPKKYDGEPPNIHTQKILGIWRCPMDVYSLWVYEIISDPYKVDFELKVGSLSSFGSFQYHHNGSWSVEDQTMRAHWFRADLETMSWLVKKYQDIVKLEIELNEPFNGNFDCKKLVITYKDGSTSKMVYLGPTDGGKIVETTTTTTTTTKGSGPDVYPPGSYQGRRRRD